MMRRCKDRRRSDSNNDDNIFTPPLDVFSDAAGTGWILHLAVPGARKQDVAVRWDADRSRLCISGRVTRSGSAEGLLRAERTVGRFERIVQLPPYGGDDWDESSSEAETDEKKKTGKADNPGKKVDVDRIVARLEGGVLVVTVPAVDKEWTAVRQVAIE